MKRKGIIITVVICCAILLSATIFSLAKFHVWNPFSSCFGMLEILFTDKEYTVVQNFPKRVILSKSDQESFEKVNKYIEDKGFYSVPEERMGAIHKYSNGSKKEDVCISGNGYYTRWIWE